MKEHLNRTEQLKSYLRRLGAGEDLAAVRADFVKEFSEVEAVEIMRAEQELLEEGTPLEEVQKLCDIHSALFHGATREEKIAEAEKAVAKSLLKEQATKLENIPGHPLYTLSKENEALSTLLEQMNTVLIKENDSTDLLHEIRAVAIHYAKKGDLLYPHLKVKYGISGPADVMWTVDDEIRDELSELTKMADTDKNRMIRLKNVLNRIKEMIYKEQNILFPTCAANFTENEWKMIYQDMKDYPVCFGIAEEIWQAAETAVLATDEVPQTRGTEEDEIWMPGGHLTREQLIAMLDTIPLEITFIDADNINRYFNDGSKVFKRPKMAIDRDVFSCHPPKIEPMVRGIIEDFRSGKRDTVPVWLEKNGRSMLITYMAVRDKNKNYIGTMELVQDMEFAKKHFS